MKNLAFYFLIIFVSGCNNPTIADNSLIGIWTSSFVEKESKCKIVMILDLKQSLYSHSQSVTCDDSLSSQQQTTGSWVFDRKRMVVLTTVDNGKTEPIEIKLRDSNQIYLKLTDEFQLFERQQ